MNRLINLFSPALRLDSSVLSEFDTRQARPCPGSFQRLCSRGNFDERQYRKRLVSVLCQTSESGLGEAPVAPQGQKRMLHKGAPPALGDVDLHVPLALGFVMVRPCVGEVFGAWGVFLDRLLLTQVDGVTMQQGVFAMQQAAQLLTVMHAGRSHTDVVHQAAGTVHSNVHFHTEVPLIAFLGLHHFRAARPVGILGRAGRGNDGGVHGGASAQRQSLGL